MSSHIPPEIQNVINGKLFDTELRARISSWNEPVFVDFLVRNSTKVASKFRSAVSFEDQRDLGLELYVARIFSMAGCVLTYEPKRKGPDFLCKHTDGQFYCEVRRIRDVALSPDAEIQDVNSPSGQFKKLGDIIFDKFRQAEIGHVNVLYVRSNRIFLRKHHLEAAFKSLLELMESGDDAVFRAHGYSRKSEFAELASYWSAIVFDDLWPMHDDPDRTARVYVNAHARTRLSPELLAVFYEAVKISFLDQRPGSGA